MYQYVSYICADSPQCHPAVELVPNLLMGPLWGAFFVVDTVNVVFVRRSIVVQCS